MLPKDKGPALEELEERCQRPKNVGRWRIGQLNGSPHVVHQIAGHVEAASAYYIYTLLLNHSDSATIRYSGDSDVTRVVG